MKAKILIKFGDNPNSSVSVDFDTDIPEERMTVAQLAVLRGALLNITDQLKTKIERLQN